MEIIFVVHVPYKGTGLAVGLKSFLGLVVFGKVLDLGVAHIYYLYKLLGEYI